MCLRAMDCARTPSASRSDFSPERIQVLRLVSLEHITRSILVLRGRKLLLGELECRDHHHAAALKAILSAIRELMNARLPSGA
jgi:hypothetical protein